jgi:signal transduction histidine kinase
MSFRERLRFYPLRSLYFAVILAMVGTMSLSFLVFQHISTYLERMHFNPVYDRLDELQMEASSRILNSEGPKGLADYLAHIDRISGAHHYLLDAHGVDLLGGQVRAEFLPPSPATKWRIRTHGHTVAAQRSADGRYWFAAVGPTSLPQVWMFIPYYFLNIGATILLCWLASVGVVSPIRRIAASIARFGHGDLSVRVYTKRRDEIGQLGSSFNEMAERLQRMIASERRLLADISHELRSPLARLKFAVKLAKTSTDADAAFDRINRDVDRIASLVAGIVESTAVEGESDAQRMKMVHVADVVDEVVRDCTLEAEVRGCRILSNGSFGGEVLGNRELLRRAVENILRNGIRYTPQHATIDVSVVEDSGGASIVIRDYGPGVPEDSLERIFDPFFRVEEARDALGGGSGLGLSIAKRAVQMHHGSIAAENALPGLRVKIRIPIFDASLKGR